ncbi:hypothetical protein L484_014979 [Morus notabilis]|uniref:Protein COFACTOR ASSEMBLY OF COMPLEX C SUBUNIT B CCB3 n=1 Tax=Morus notabilis TaxID=981085 RepID=W9SYK6_9ROSA|nr:protein COFACTOR ASSEMBLY OF COMPLEX C SUBUNIT B CCB3, chloroplastic isoform X1 [Morus notabilis]EXC33099.1 hypothetical protein L484_014979 [Morus notabilis]
MATCSYLLNHVQIKECPSQAFKLGTSNTSERYKFLPKRHTKLNSRVAGCSLCFIKPNIEYSQFNSSLLPKIYNLHAVAEDFKIGISSETSQAVSDFTGRLVLADLDPATAKLAVGILGPCLSAFGFLFILRIVMSWYPKLPVGKFPYVIAYGPTEPLLIPTRKLIPPLGGVDVTPVVWFGLISFLNEILVGPQGLLVLLSQQVS